MKVNYKVYDFTEPWEEDKIPLLMIHGICADSNMWFYQVPIFAKKFPVIVVDLPGHGKSPIPKEKISIENISNFIHNALKEIGIEKVNVLGISLGGVIATEFTRAFKDEVNKLVIAGTPRSMPKELAPFFDNLMIEYKDLSMDDISNKGAEAGKQFIDSVPTEIVEWGKKYFAKMEHQAFMNIVEAPLKYDINKTFTLIENKTLIICGEFDPYLPVSLAEQIASEIKNSELFIMKNTGHITAIERPDEFNTKVLSFLEN